MAVKKRDFQKISQLIQEFLGKLCGEEASAELRDALNFALLHLQRYYKCLRTRSDSNGLSNSGIFKSLNTGFTAGVSAISPFCRGGDIFDWKWIHLDSPRLSGGFANDDFAMVKPCLLAAKNADLKELKELIEKDSDCVKQVDGLGRSALMYSVHGNSDEHYQCTELLIDCSSDVNLISNDGCTSLHIACHDNNLQALQLLLKHKAKCNIEDSEGRTPLHWAAANSSTHNIKLLLEHDADIRGCDNNGLTPAMWACHFDQLSNLEFLQEAVESKGCDKDTLMEDIDHDGRSLIHWAVSRNGEQNCLKKLLNKKTALLTDRDGGSVFLAAAKEGSVSACEEIFSVLGNEVLNHLNNKKQSALHIATICGHGGVVDLLLEKGADVNQVDTHGASVMDYAQSLQLHYCTLIFLSHQSQHPTQSTDMKNNQRNAENISEKNSYKTIHQSLVVPSAPLLEEVDSVEPLDEETDQKVDQSVNKRTSFDTQEQESSNTKENRKIPHPAPRQLKRNATEEQTDNTIIKPSRPQRQQTLTRQSNISDNKNESDHQEDQFDTHEFDTHTFDRKVEGEVLILVDDMEGINSESEIVINCENETSPSLLDHGHSVSSVHSEQDNAENASISMDMGVSSIGSDSEDNIDDDEADDQSNEILDDQQHQIHKHKHIKGQKMSPGTFPQCHLLKNSRSSQ